MTFLTGIVRRRQAEQQAAEQQVRRDWWVAAATSPRTATALSWAVLGVLCLQVRRTR
jgi:hypothetical protein